MIEEANIANPQHGARFRFPVLPLLFLLLLASLFVGTTRVAITSAPSFDGAMNLDVARSISEGEGFRRNYAERDVFPHEIQTGAPYVLPAAMVFKLFGVGIAQAQIANIAYFLLLLVATYFLVRRIGSRELALFAACTVAIVPGILEIGFGGYGEIPALALILAATAVFYRGSSAQPVLMAAITGILIALAVITKTVMLIGAGALALSIILECLVSEPGQRIPQLKRVCAVACGGLITLVAMEAWRAHALGGLAAWQLWWLDETGGIFKQAGVAPGLADHASGLISKLHLHLDQLSHDYRLAMRITALWLALLCLAWCVMLLRSPRRPGKWSTLAILTCAMMYMAWWLLVTPTSKAWHRRIIDGMICADIGMIMFAAGWIDDLRQRVFGNPVKASRWLVVILVLALPLVWLVKGSHALALMRSPTADDTASLLETAQRVRNLPKDAYIFGLGWYSAPRVGLLSGRTILDFNDVPVARLQAGRPIYFIQAPGDSSDYLQHVRLKYDLQYTTVDGYALIRAQALTPTPLVASGANVRRHIRAGDNYPYMRGFNDAEGSSGRWLSDDNIVLLTPMAGDRFELVAYTLSVSAYRYKNTPLILVSFNGCAAPAQASAPNKVQKFSFAIPDNCHVKAGQPVNVRIEIDNLVDVSVTRDPRPLGIKGIEIGFAGVGPSPDDQTLSIR